MAVISHEHKFIYALSPRTASTATADYLRRNLAAQWIPGEDFLDESGNIILDRKHSAFRELIEYKLIQKKTVKQYLTFITVRNPFQSIFSAWYKKKYTYQKLLQQKNTFVHKKPGFVEDMMFVKENTFSDWILAEFKNLAEDNVERHLNGKYMDYADRVIRFENLNQDFKQLMEEYDIPYFGEIPMLNKTEGKPDTYQSYYTDEAKKIIQRAYALDINKFSYSF